jgi:hypothetical protein
MSVHGESADKHWIDRTAITDLIFRYADSVTRGDWDQNEAVFAPDAIYEIGAPFNVRYLGARAIREHLSEGMTHLEFLVQTAYGPVVQLVDDDHARATTTTHALLRGTAGVPTPVAEPGDQVSVEQYGVWYDDVVKVDGAWKFAHRRFQPIYVSTAGLSGEVLSPR